MNADEMKIKHFRIAIAILALAGITLLVAAYPFSVAWTDWPGRSRLMVFIGIAMVAMALLAASFWYYHKVELLEWGKKEKPVQKKIFHVFYDNDKLEPWLNEMCGKGWALTYKMFSWHFDPCEPGEYIYRLKESDSVMGTEEEELIALMKERGAEYVMFSRGVMYFRKKASEGSFEIHVDIESQLRNCTKRVTWDIVIMILACAVLAYFIRSEYVSMHQFAQDYFIENFVTERFIPRIIPILLPVLLSYIFGIHGTWLRIQKVRKLKKERLMHE